MDRPVSHMISRVLELVLKSDENLIKILEVTLNSKAAEAFGKAAGQAVVDNAMNNGSFSVGDL